MIAIARPSLLLPSWLTPRRRFIRDKRSWLRRLIDPLAAYATGDPVTDSAGNPLVDSAGNPIVDGGSLNCCLYQARDCATNTLQSLYVRKSQFPAFPSTYYFKLGDTCYYVQASDKVACTNTPNVSGETAEASCSACTGGSCPIALVTFSGIIPCPSCATAGDGYNQTQSVESATFCLQCCSQTGTGTSMWEGYMCFCDLTTTYQAWWNGGPPSCPMTPPAFAQGLSIFMRQTESAGTYYWNIYTYWSQGGATGSNFVCVYGYSSGENLNPVSFFQNQGVDSPNPVIDVRSGGAAHAGDSYTFDNDLTVAYFCADGRANNWGYGGTCNVTFADPSYCAAVGGVTS